MPIEMSALKTALIVIDVQKAFDQMEAAGQTRNNPEAIGNIVRLLDTFRARQGEIIHVRHASLEATSLFRQELSGFAVKDEAVEHPGERVVVKQVNASFIGTDLDHILKQRAVGAVVIVGATTNHCVETTARMAGNLGYKTYVVSDATWTFDRIGIDGANIPAEDIHYMTLSNLKDEFAQIVTTQDILDWL